MMLFLTIIWGVEQPQQLLIKWDDNILVQSELDYGENDSVVRLNNVIKGDKSGISDFDDVKWQGGEDFVYLELAKWNEEAKEKILKAKSLSDLIKLFDELYEKYFLNYNVEVKKFEEKIIKEEEFEKAQFGKAKGNVLPNA